ncbi:MAG TPA: protease inhibitor I42 family protein [Candidatus Dependentiae bacterium]|nr:protease inhibitor I42 family protein [Candidatus Dependentiae bacterium]
MKALMFLILSSILGTHIYAQDQVKYAVVQPKVKNINLKVGESWNLDLRSLPGAGFLWMVKNTDPSNREIVHIEKDSEPAKEGLIGGPVYEHWTFKAVQPGKAKIILEYARPSDPSTLSDSLILDFSVMPK